MRYSLQTLMIVVAVVGIWLGYHLRWIRQRSDAQTWVRNQASEWSDMPIQQGVVAGKASPWRIRMLGADGVKTISVMAYKEQEAEKKRELSSLFPEAQVRVYTPGPGYHGGMAK